MQTFLPLPDFAESAATLDRMRLGKQRVECMQILRTNLGHTHGWCNHPAVKMWRGYDQALASYTLYVCSEWTSRGYADSIASWVESFLETCPDWDDAMYPPWLGDDTFHSTHRAALLAKLPEHYSKFGWTETPTINYRWPHVAV
jgi:hypothetical protein